MAQVRGSFVSGLCQASHSLVRLVACGAVALLVACAPTANDLSNAAEQDLRRGNYAAAEQGFAAAAAAATQPYSRARAYEYMGQAQFRAGKHAEAAASLRRARATAPDLYTGLSGGAELDRYLVAALIGAGDMAGAEQAAEEFTRLAPHYRDQTHWSVGSPTVTQSGELLGPADYLRGLRVAANDQAGVATLDRANEFLRQNINPPCTAPVNPSYWACQERFYARLAAQVEQDNLPLLAGYYQEQQRATRQTREYSERSQQTLASYDEEDDDTASQAFGAIMSGLAAGTRGRSYAPAPRPSYTPPPVSTAPSLAPALRQPDVLPLQQARPAEPPIQPAASSNRVESCSQSLATIGGASARCRCENGSVSITPRAGGGQHLQCTKAGGGWGCGYANGRSYCGER
jgi:tetratricopeptide (TPR) repeat protein